MPALPPSSIKPTALILNVREKGTEYLEHTCPDHVRIFNKFSDIPLDQFELVITVKPFIYEADIKMVSYFPKVLHLGIGCRKDLKGDPVEMHQHIIATLIDNNLCPESIADISSIDLKRTKRSYPCWPTVLWTVRSRPTRQTF